MELTIIIDIVYFVGCSLISLYNIDKMFSDKTVLFLNKKYNFLKRLKKELNKRKKVKKAVK